MRLQTLRANFAAEFIDIEAAAMLPGATWEPFQIEFLNNSTRFGIDVKARQIAWSFTAALDAFCDSRINPGLPHIFVSINLEEAKEKIRYLRNIIEATDAPARPKRFVTDSQTHIELEDGSRFISHPCRPVRGKAKTRIYLDEMAHYPAGMDRQIYTAALPSTVKGDGYIRIGSSPLGATGLFWEIATESIKEWPGFTRRFIPWWSVRALAANPDMAIREAPMMVTEDRVRMFGTPALLEIFDNMFLEDFQQEYECAWVDESSAWIPWAIIQRNQDADLLWWHATSVDGAIGMLPEILEAIQEGRIEPVLCGGIDIGRKHDLSEFMVLGKAEDKRPLRFSISLDRVEFDEQEMCFRHIIDSLPFTQVLVDSTGLGMQLGENLARATGRVQPVEYTNASKELWAVEARIQAERENTPLPMDRDIAYQIHSIKKKVTAAKNNVFDTDKSEKHHADKFWAWATAIWAGKDDGRLMLWGRDEE